MSVTRHNTTSVISGRIHYFRNILSRLVEISLLNGNWNKMRLVLLMVICDELNLGVVDKVLL